MDEFGVLTERYGIKPQGKSAPMAASKRSSLNTPSPQTWKSTTTTTTSYSSSNKASGTNGSSSYNTDDIFFTSSSSTSMNGASSGGGFDDFDVFGGLNKTSSSAQSFNNNNNNNNNAHHDLFGASNNNNDDDIFGSFSSSTKQYAPVDDLLGDMAGFGLKSNNLNNSAGLGKNGFDELLPGFGPPSHTTPSKTTASNFADADDPFVVLESTISGAHSSSSGVFVDPLDAFAASVTSQTRKPSNTASQPSTKLKPPPKPTQKVNRAKSSVMSSGDELGDFAMGGTMRRSASASDAASKYREAEETKQQFGVDDLDSFFSSGPRSSSVPKSRTATEVTPKPAVNVTKKTTNGVSSAKKPPSPANLVDDFSALFGEDPIFKEFEEIPGETEERRKARWDREQRTKSRVAQAVADMNNRDHQSRIEQEQRTRISESADAEIKRWATGKEGNMRALLSSLQIVLWPGCGWEAVSLTDLITSSAVKKVYRKATLYVHPDKVQQKGATLEQKYIAEKVFDILKEAWNKFNKEELS
ncbi:auxilin-related protein 2 isoform X2 [Raphanus sativus]|uniref:Auxilin-related protein 2 isoform X2 n=1 Tax=Raphanus sativus TaxID=3726 RepID=A0A6J0K0G6_RAPSA|nr:auxilin-related protein 2 isoform X2 [Raphanus sativus]